MKYILFIYFFIFSYEKIYSNQLIQNPPSSDTLLYTLLPSIEESCKNIIFTDNMYRAWNAASVENIKISTAKDSNDCLERMIPFLIKGENPRLEFGKMLNNDSIISIEDIKKGFFIVEEIISTSSVSYMMYLTIHVDDKLKIFSYKMDWNCTWHLIDTSVVSKKKFYTFYNSIKRQKARDEIYPVVNFMVTEFTEERIKSYIFSCEGSRKCINQFYKLIGRNP